MDFRATSVIVTAAVLCWLVPLNAQTAKVVVTAASVTINPAATDSYTISGTFTGLDFTDAQHIWFSVGSFGATFPIDTFHRSAGSKVLTYRDSTGQAPGWISGLVIDPVAQTFQAQAAGIVLAGLSNPFPVQLGTEQMTSCTMVRVSQTTSGAYQLTAGDPRGMTCEMASTPTATPNVVAAGSATKVTVSFGVQNYLANDTLQNPQLFQADGNGQPQGPALCTLTGQTNGSYACTIQINQSSPGMVPFLMQATVGSSTVLSSGFAVQVAGQPSSSDIQQLSAVQAAMTQAWQQLVQFGDTAYARQQILKTLRSALAPPAELTAMPLGLSLDGLSIYVRSNTGLPVVMPLDDVAGFLGTSSDPVVSLEKQPANPAISRNSVIEAAQGAAPRAQTQPLSCGSFQRDIVWNNAVLFWAPGTVFGFDEFEKMASVFQNSACPSFAGQVDTVTGNNATIASLNNFSNYGAVFIDSHGGVDSQSVFLVTGEPSPAIWSSFPAYGVEGVGCFANGCFKTVYPNNPNIHALNNTIIYAGFCYSINGRSAFSTAFAPSGSNSTYYGYWVNSPSVDDVRYGVPLVKSLVNDLSSTGDAYNAAEAAAGTMLNRIGVQNAPPGCRAVTIMGKCPVGNWPGMYPGSTTHFQFLNDPNLAYIGNPHLTETTLSPPVQGAQGLAAYIEGGASCGMGNAPYINVQWANTANSGHLTPATGGVMGSPPDHFSDEASAPTQATSGTLNSQSALAAYTPIPSTTNSDQVMADFLTNQQNPPVGRACMTVGGTAGLFVNGQLAAVWDDQAPNIPGITQFAPPVQVKQTYTVPLNDPGGYSGEGATASVTITPAGQNTWTVTVLAGGANPNFPNANPQPGSGPFQGRAVIQLGAINPGPTSKVQITAQIQNQPFCQTLNPGGQACTAADGTIIVGDSQGHLLEDGSLYLGDPNALGSSFSVTADSSCSGVLQPTAQCPQPTPVGINVSLTEAFATAPMPTVFSVQLTIQFLSQ